MHPTEYKTIDGLVYERQKGLDGDYYNPHWVLSSQVCISRDEKGMGTYAKQEGGDAPGVICDCGGTEFSLRYGEHEIRARCSKCGVEGLVYDG